METWITNPDAAWSAKLHRANTHLETLNKLVDEFEATEPYSLSPEPGHKPDKAAYRLRIMQQTPPEISTVVGDVLHNLRSAADSVAYELAVQRRAN